MNFKVVLVLATTIFIVFIVTSVVMLRADERRRRIIRRRVAIIAPYTLPEALAESIARLSVVRPAAAIKRRLQHFIGMDSQRRDPYPVRLILLIPISVIGGLIVRWLLHGLLGSVAWILVPLTAWFTMRSVYKGLDAKRSARLYRQFPDALATIVRAVRVGIPVTEAIGAVARDAEAPTCIEFGRLYDQIGIGAALEDALRDMAVQNHLPEYRFFATALALQSQTGGGLTETLDNLGDVVRRRVALKARGFALASEARTSAAILAALPVLAGSALMVMSPGYIAPLLEEGNGQTIFGGAVVWLGLGMFVMRSMIRKSLS